jgi:hypothetical protein
VKGGFERFDVRIRGEFLRYKDTREVAVCTTLSKPPPGPFDLSEVTEDTGRPRNKAVRYGWIKRNRVEDFVQGLWDQDGLRFWKQRSKNELQSLWYYLEILPALPKNCAQVHVVLDTTHQLSPLHPRSGASPPQCPITA